jgi:hypothetical protein
LTESKSLDLTGLIFVYPVITHYFLIFEFQLCWIFLLCRGLTWVRDWNRAPVVDFCWAGAVWDLIAV